MDFQLVLRSLSKFEIPKAGFLATNANPPFSKIGKGVIQDGLQALIYHLEDMHTLTLKIHGYHLAIF
jgi:hypothetical protein